MILRSSSSSLLNAASSGDSPLPLRSHLIITKGDYLFQVVSELPAGALAADRENLPDEGSVTVETRESEDGEEGETVEVETSSSVFDLDPVQDFLLGASFAVDPSLANADQWYESKFDWDAEWDFNAFVSIGTSLAFTLVMLAISFWRLRRMDF